MPSPSRTGIAETSTVSTRPTSRKARKSWLPPKSQMSLPLLAFSACTQSVHNSGMMVSCGCFLFHGAGEDDGGHPAECVLAQPFDGNLVSEAAHQAGVELRPDGGEVNLGVGVDPVEFSVRASDKAVEAHGHDITNTSHGCLSGVDEGRAVFDRERGSGMPSFRVSSGNRPRLPKGGRCV